MARGRKRPAKGRLCRTKEKMTETDALSKALRLYHKDKARMYAFRCTQKCYLPNGAKAWHVGRRTKRRR